jgi:hypothetical protein
MNFNTEAPDEAPAARLARLEHQLVELESTISRTDARVWPEEYQRLQTLLRHRVAGVEYQRRICEGRK